jgi:alpha-L-fucosidase
MNKSILSLAILGTIAIQPLSVFAEDKPAATASIPASVPNTDRYANETKEQRDARMAWFRDGRFGMFVHWGPYAVLGGEYKGKRVGGNPEWIQHTGRIPYKEYEQIAASFNPASFDAAAIVRTAKDAGMKYVVITSKHHDGFCMWDTKLTDYNIVKWTPFKRDVIGELSRECRKQGLRFGIYYSVRDWHHPDWTLRYVDLEQPRQYNSRWGFPPSPWTRGNYYACGCPACGGNISTQSKEFDPRPTEAEGADMNRYLDYMKGQLEELVSMYKPDLMWFDAQDIVDSKLGRVDEMIAAMRSLNPGVIISDRISGEGVFGDYGIHEGKIPGSGSPREWETCMTMNDTWGYSKFDKNFKSAETIVRMLVDTTSKNGNLLLNVAPDGEGDIPEGNVQSLQDAGKWMAVNRESIYGCGSSGLPSPDWGKITAKGDNLYLHVFQWPADGKLLVTKPRGNVKQAFLLADPGKTPLSTVVSKKGLSITVPQQAPCAIDSVIVLTLDRR